MELRELLIGAVVGGLLVWLVLRAAYAARLASAATERDVLPERVVDLIHAEVSYVTGATSVQTRASEAWEQRSGVCQDMAHLTIGALRSVGVPVWDSAVASYRVEAQP